jgi:hypothetical protein
LPPELVPKKPRFSPVIGALELMTLILREVGGERQRLAVFSAGSLAGIVDLEVGPLGPIIVSAGQRVDLLVAVAWEPVSERRRFMITVEARE